MLFTIFLTQLALAANFDVDVGESGLTFKPDSVKASAGDTVTFHFYPNNHSMVQASFDKPCQPLDKGAFSGFFPTKSESSETFMIEVKDSNPLWYYCSQGDHCQDGMVGVINPPASGDQSLSNFKANALNAGSSKSPAMIQGGTRSSGGAMDNNMDMGMGNMMSADASSSSSMSSSASSASQSSASMTMSENMPTSSSSSSSPSSSSSSSQGGNGTSSATGGATRPGYGGIAVAALLVATTVGLAMA